MNNKNYLKLFFACILLLLVLAFSFASPEGLPGVESAPPVTWEEYADDDGMVEILIFLNEQADTASLAAKTKDSRGKSKAEVSQAVVKSLQETAGKSQRYLLQYLQSEKAGGRVDELESFFIVNVIYARVAVELIDEIGARREVASIRPNEEVEVIGPLTDSMFAQGNTASWNIDRVKAPQVWTHGVDGSGVVVGIIDTGVDMQHEALLQKYRGYDPGGNHDHAYNWFDPYQKSAGPTDNHGHGTHCTGTVLGSDPDGNNLIGVAPGAQWIAARGLSDQGTATIDKLIQCAEYLLAPTPNHNGSGVPDPSRAPDIILNSWGGGAGYNEVFRDIVRAWRDAGILTVFAAGNDGPGEQTLHWPANYPESLSVAAIDINNQLASFSSRGPSPYPEPDHMQPLIAAPGVGIRSAHPNNVYKSGQGTSMAAPHVAGVAALLLSYDDSLTVDELTERMINSARPLTDATYNQSPNYGYGFGLVDALVALNLEPVSPPLEQYAVFISAAPETATLTGQRVTFTAHPTGFEQPVYEFSYRLAGAEVWVFAQPGVSSSYTVTPVVNRDRVFDVRVRVRESGEQEWLAGAEVTHTVLAILPRIKLEAEPAERVVAGEQAIFSTETNVNGSVYQFGWSKNGKHWYELTVNETGVMTYDPCADQVDEYYIGVRELTTGVTDCISYQVVVD